MPDLHTQLRDYARFATGVVEPVGPDEVMDRRVVVPARRVPARAIAGIITFAAAVAAVAAVAAGLFWARPEDRPLRVTVQPPAPTTPATTVAPGPATAAAVEPSDPAAPSFAARARSTGIPGTRRHADGATSIRVVTLSGEGFWVTVPDDIALVEGVQVVPGAVFVVTGAPGFMSFLTTLSARQLAEGECEARRSCETLAVRSQARQASGANLTLWQVGRGAIDPFATVEMGRWTLVVDGLDTAASERFAAALVWSIDGEGYLHLRSADADVAILYEEASLSAGVTGEPKDGLHISIMPGCDARPELTWPAVRPELTSNRVYSAGIPTASTGLWCAAGRYRVEVTTGDAAVLNRLYERLRIEPAR